MLTISEELTITVEDVCGEGVYLRWQNDYGGIDQYYFTGNIADLIEQSNTEYFEPYVEDLATSTENIKTVSVGFNKTKRVYAVFDKANKEAFEQLVRSKQIEMYINSTWYRVGVQLETMQIEKMKTMGKITLQVVPPKTYTTS